MAATPRFYRKYIATGSGFLIFSIFYAIIIRIFYSFYFETSSIVNGENFLWNPIANWFSHSYVSLISSTIVVGILAFLAAHINNKELLIRQKTLLPSALLILLFSSHPSFINMSGEYISILITMIILLMLFSAYNREKNQGIAFQTSFMLALSSLFSFSDIIYLPMLWVGLAIMRSFNLKALMASFLGIFIVYFPIFSWFLLTDKIQNLLTPITNIFTTQISNVPIVSYDLREWVVLGCCILLLLIIISDDYINRHKDKIKVRNCFNLLFILAIYAFIAFLFLNINSQLHLFSLFIVGAFILSHFFALVERKSGSILFYFVLLLYFSISLSPFFFPQ